MAYGLAWLKAPVRSRPQGRKSHSPESLLPTRYFPSSTSAASVAAVRTNPGHLVLKTPASDAAA